MRPRIVAFVALAIALAALFARLGFWQLDRLAERKAANDRIRQQLAKPLVPVAYVQNEGDRANRYAFVEGTPDYEHEFVHAGRSRNGSPGVHIFTPIKTGDMTAVLVNRGWVYAADAATVDLSAWREPRRVFRGYTREMPADGPTSAQGRSIRTLSHAGIQPLLPYPVQRLYIVSTDPVSEHSPARLSEPDLTNGPHLSYAVQWFCFAGIAVIGAGVVLLRSRRERSGSQAA